MKICRNFITISIFFSLLCFSANHGYSQTCPNPARVFEDSSNHPTIQEAYDHADLNWSEFTLRLAADTIEEDLIIDGGSVLLDGGYECTFFSKVSVTNILGSIPGGSCPR